MNSAEEKFLKAALPIYSSYLERLQAGDKEDFDGLMWRAIERVQQGATQLCAMAAGSASICDSCVS